MWLTLISGEQQWALSQESFEEKVIQLEIIFCARRLENRTYIARRFGDWGSLPLEEGKDVIFPLSLTFFIFSSDMPPAMHHSLFCSYFVFWLSISPESAKKVLLKNHSLIF